MNTRYMPQTTVAVMSIVFGNSRTPSIYQYNTVEKAEAAYKRFLVPEQLINETEVTLLLRITTTSFRFAKRIRKFNKPNTKKKEYKLL